MILIVYLLTMFWAWLAPDFGLSRPIALLVGAAVLVVVGAFSGQLSWPWRK